MQEKNLLWKIVALILPALLAGYFLYTRELKLGIDLDGGHSLLYEIDDSGLDAFEKTDLAERVMEVLQRRVDPNRIRGLVWRPIGNNRLEIQMPRPPENVGQLGDKSKAAQKTVTDLNVELGELAAFVALPSDQRTARLAALTKGLTVREVLLQSVAESYDAHQSAQADAPGSAAATDAKEAYDKAAGPGAGVQKVLLKP